MPKSVKKPRGKSKNHTHNPTGNNRPKIDRSPHKRFYLNALRTGWSTYELAKVAKNKYSEDISSMAFQRYRRRMPSKMALPPALLRKRFNIAKADFDAIEEYKVLIYVQQERLNRILNVEDKTEFVTEVARKEVETLSKLLKDLVALEQDTGVREDYRRNSGGTFINNVSNNGENGYKTIGELLQGLGADKATDLVKGIGALTNRLEGRSSSLLPEEGYKDTQ